MLLKGFIQWLVLATACLGQEGYLVLGNLLQSSNVPFSKPCLSTLAVMDTAQQGVDLQI